MKSSPNTSEFEHKLRAYKQELTAFIDTLLTRQRPVTLYEPMRYALQSGGKKLRPSLLLLCTEALGGDSRAAVPAAAAVEILHNFTLVHDDIMDHDETRRGRPTVHARWDADTALLAGDGLVALAYQSLFQTNSDRLFEICNLFTEGIIELCEGQALDREFESRSDVTMDEYLEMIAKKTARLLSMCTQIGGMLAGASSNELEALKKYGENLGLAFQIQDDVLDITAEQDVLGKDFGSDVKQSKKTFLLVHALRYGDDRQKALIASHLAQEKKELNDIFKIRTAFEEIGSIRCANETIQRCLDDARLGLQQLAAPARSDTLELFLQLILNRKA